MTTFWEITKWAIGVLIFSAVYVLLTWSPAHAQVASTSAAVRFNNDNLMTTPQPAPVASGYDFGDMSIIPLQEGKTLIVHKYILDPEYQVDIWEYQMDDAYWWVTNKGVIFGENSVGDLPMASSSLQALSIYLTL